MGSKNKREVNESISHSDLGYIAGVIDVKGAFSISGFPSLVSDRFSWRCELWILSSNRALIEKLNSIIFLNTSSIDAVKSSRTEEKSIFRISLCGPALDVIIPRIRDMLIVKQRHADLVLRYRETISLLGRGFALPDEIVSERVLLERKMAELNSEKRIV